MSNMCLESTKQKYVLFSAFAKEYGHPHGMLNMFEALRRTSTQVFGTDRYALSPLPVEALVSDYIDAGLLQLSNEGVEITDVGLGAKDRLKRYINQEDLDREKATSAA